MKWASRVLALLLPAAVLGVSIGVLSNTVPIQKSKERLHMESHLASQKTRVLVLGNSTASLHIDKSVLAAGLSLETVEVTQLVVPESRLKAWYAVLRHPVFGEGHRPDLIIVASTLEDLIAESDIEGRTHLVEWVRLATTNPEPGTVLERARAKGRKLRSTLLAGIRDRAVRVVFGGDRAFAEAALENVLGANGTANPSLHDRVVPVVEEQTDAGAAADISVGGGSLPGTPPPIHAVPGFVQLVHQHGARAIFVRLPDSIDGRRVEPALERMALDVCREQGLGYLDLREAILRDGTPGELETPSASRTLAQQLLVRGLLSKGASSVNDPNRQRGTP